MDVNKSPQMSSGPIKKVLIHPLVLLSIVDHYNRVSQQSFRRVVGVLLGTSFQGIVDVSNSYAVPFEEEVTDPSVWSLNHNYHEAMLSMFKKINGTLGGYVSDKEHVVGWYSTGPKLRANDLDIHRLFHNYVPNPILVITDVRSREPGIPTNAYYDVEEGKENPTQKSQKVFVHVPSEIAADEVEEIGVGHLLRDVKDTTISTLATEVSDKLTAIKGLDARLRRISWYLGLLIIGWYPLNHEDVVNHCPNLNVPELIKAFVVKSNDMMWVIYLTALIRCVIALHNLINNKILYKEYEKAEDAKLLAFESYHS
ncbi:26S proteasome non-ATPase regulatory subunit 7 homolog A-like isoform X2 [Neltuma alba]|uniref:26S proteasome non-ATPase regulatory subunit 7 homolog A-like isoform X2 n=1 Tax=Neltuma alba TaxID=207710 RepID=UPI0010A4692C|nr:26S proteasome non-ATPase regulatory subunit 7 homolog A-like isoform X2 [Prosopis alba]